MTKTTYTIKNSDGFKVMGTNDAVVAEAFSRGGYAVTAVTTGEN